MPEVRYYEVEQTRVVKVAANDEAGALAVATQAFETANTVEQIDSWGHSVGAVQVTDVTIRKERY